MPHAPRPTCTTLQQRGDPMPAVDHTDLVDHLRVMGDRHQIPASVIDALLDPASYAPDGTLRRFTVCRRLNITPDELTAALDLYRSVVEGR